MKVIFTLLLSLGILLVEAQTIITDRPDQTESPMALGSSNIQLETGFSYMTEEHMGGELISLSYPSMLVRLGLLDRLELRLVTQIETIKYRTTGGEVDRASGIGNVQLGFKYQLTKSNGSFPEIGFISHLVIPKGSLPLNDGKYGVVSKLAVSHDLSENHSLAYNIGYDFYGYGNGDLFYSLAWGVSLSEKTAVYLEPYGFVENMDTFIVNADAGITYLINDRLQLDYSYGVGINQLMSYHSVGVSFLLLGD